MAKKVANPYQAETTLLEKAKIKTPNPNEAESTSKIFNLKTIVPETTSGNRQVKAVDAWGKKKK
jgi:hypothetical protein